VSRRTGRQKLAALVESLDPKVIAMEACASAHYWARLFIGSFDMCGLSIRISSRPSCAVLSTMRSTPLIRGVNDAPRTNGKGEERDDMLRVLPPAVRDCRILAASIR
jgi:hypothetical protein